jgi:uncharacterized protein
MSLRATSTMIRTLDGLHLAGTVVTPDGTPERAVVLVHGAGVTREEGGFFTRLATGLGEAGVASLLFGCRSSTSWLRLREPSTVSRYTKTRST